MLNSDQKKLAEMYYVLSDLVFTISHAESNEDRINAAYTLLEAKNYVIAFYDKNKALLDEYRG